MWMLSLSPQHQNSSYLTEEALECKALVLNINYGNNRKAHRKEVTTMFLADYDPTIYYKTLKEEGIEEGINIGEDNINLLAQKMSADQRLDDFLRSTSDKAYQKQLLKEYGLTE